jgi:RNA polymerase sigma-70 factor, ECF subfamily
MADEADTNTDADAAGTELTAIGRPSRLSRGLAPPASRQDGGLERLFRAEFAGLVHTVRIIVGDVDTASDVVQEAFLQASRHWEQVATYERPAGWLRRVAVNRALDELRRHRRREAALPRLAWLARRPAETPLSHEAALDFDAAVARLPKQQRAVVALFYGADLPVAEIAGLLGIAEGTVKAHLHAARRALASLLEDDDADR